MKFEDMKYERPDVEKMLAELKALEQIFSSTTDEKEYKEAFDRLEALNRHFDTMASLASVRYTIHTQDPLYSKEADWFDEITPAVVDAQNKVIKALLNNPLQDSLKETVPQIWFARQENALRSMDEAIVEDLQKENALATRYQKLIASAQIEFDGETLNLSGLAKKQSDLEEDVRKRATLAYWDWFAQHEDELGEIYDSLVQVRTQMARKLGFDNYLPLGYLRMDRMDYGIQDVEALRKEVLRDVVPAADQLFAVQAVRIGHANGKLPVWDEKLTFADGAAAPVLSEEDMVKAAGKMYAELSPQTEEFFQMMQDNDLMSLSSAADKAAGGYCTSFADSGEPFIFANFNQTRDDVETLTHEAGHAFQAWMSRGNYPSLLVWPTMESAEIHSMSMEFLTWPWMKDFFGENTDKFYHAHLADAITFIPYGTLVDHFQHEVYAHPEWSHADRMAAWRSLEQQYLPYKDYEGIDVLERGGWWMRQLHIFLDPLYYIDYVLAQSAALQMWKRSMDKDPDTFADYLKICQAGGTLSYRQILETAHLKEPFSPGALREIVEPAMDWLGMQEKKEG